MVNGVCWVAGDTKLETPEGPLTAKTLAAKPAPVLSREAGRVRFRALRDGALAAESQPTLRITLEGGANFRVGPQQIVMLADGGARRAEALAAGDSLATAFAYPPGYEYRDDRADAATAVSEGGIRVERIEPGGEADLFRFAVNVSGCFFVAAGVLCRSD